LKIDLHVHTNVSSPCSFMTPRGAIRRAAETGLDAICVTEHDEIAGAEVACELGRKLGFPVFKGIEIYTEFGDMLVYGLYRDPPGWRTPFAELLEMCRGVGAVIAPAHSCRVTGELERIHGTQKADWLLNSVDAIETHNGGCTPGGNRAAQELARRYNLPGIGGSDAHYEFQIGRCFTEFEGDVRTDQELVAALRSGGCHGVCLQQPGSDPDGLKE
jgi:predicted metal-dependent phosphoesterase TrpH